MPEAENSVAGETGKTRKNTASSSRLSSPHAWVSSTYFAEGFPYSVVHSLSELLFTFKGASLQAIGLTSLFHLPWNLKFLWGPLLDGFATKKRWMLWMEMLIAGMLLILAFASTLSNVLVVSSVIFVLLAILSATHDIAIDGYYLEALDEQKQSQFVGYRATSYKVAMLVVGGPMVILIDKIGWFWGFIAVAIVMALLWAYHARYLPAVESEKRPISLLFKSLFRFRIALWCIVLAVIVAGLRTYLVSSWHLEHMALLESGIPWLFRISLSGYIGLALLAVLVLVLLALKPIKRRMANNSDSFYTRAFVDFLSQEQVGLILAFIILFRAGESFLLKMRLPFLRDVGMSMAEYGFASGTVGLAFSFIGTLAGGYLIAKTSLRRWLWPFVLMQNVLNLLFAALAYYVNSISAMGAEQVEVSLNILTALISLESLGSGLGTAVFMVYMMRCCRSEFKAAHMAILTALMSVGFTVAGVSSGFLAEWLGFTNYFLFSFLATVPGMMLLPFIPYLDGKTAAKPV